MQLALARREKMKASVAFIGGSGSGKTLSMLLVAFGMMKEAYPDLPDDEVWKKVGVVDTEHKRSMLYADTTKSGVKIHPFYCIVLEAPYTIVRFEESIKLLKNAGCEVVLIDSSSHAWEGAGGILDLKESFGDNFQAWNKVKPTWQQFVKMLTENEVHILASMRTKQEYQVQQGDTGKLEVKKLGLKPIQRDDLEYEFMIVWRIDQDHVASAVKDNSSMFEGESVVLKPEHGSKLFKWLEDGVDVREEEENERQALISKIGDLIQKSEELVKFVEGLEFKAGSSVENMNLKMVRRAFDLTMKESNKSA